MINLRPYYYFEPKEIEHENGSDHLVVGRVINKNRGHFSILHDQGISDATLSGKFIHEALYHVDYPSVGDWVLMVEKSQQEADYIIKKLIPRKNAFVRRQKIVGGRKIMNDVISGGTTQEQVLASNLDTVFIVTGLDSNFNTKRIERYLTLAYNSGANPVIILSKLDLCQDVAEKVSDVEKVALGVPILPLSAISDEGMEALRAYLGVGKTVCFLGSSGVGKSTITNYLLGGQIQDTMATSESNSKGRHTTTTAQLLIAQDGTMIIDTPGLREVQLWCDEDTLETTFDDVASLMEACKFANCTHNKEPGCAVNQALESGSLSLERYKSYLKMLREVKHLDKRKKEAEQKLNKKPKRTESRHTNKQKISVDAF